MFWRCLRWLVRRSPLRRSARWGAALGRLGALLEPRSRHLGPDSKPSVGQFCALQGAAIWADELASRSAQRFCRHLRFDGWSQLSEVCPNTGLCLVFGGPLALSLAQAVDVFLRPLSLVLGEDPGVFASSRLCAKLDGRDDLLRRHRLDCDDVVARLRDGRAVAWTLEASDLAEQTDGPAPWALAAQQAGSEVWMLQAQLEAPSTLHLTVEALRPESLL